MSEEKELKIRSIEELQKKFDEVFLMADRGVVPLICATVVANQLDNDPVWLLIISPPSGGKTELIESIDTVSLRGKPLAFPISDLTVNTFASGQKKTGKETSLLHKMSIGSIMTFKDFTSMISKNKDAQAEIMSQLREVYDQKYVKRTGTGDDIVWKGKVGAIAGCTEIIYEKNEEFAVMGDRFIMYSMIQPERMDVLERVVESMKDKGDGFKKKKNHLKECMKDYLEFVFEHQETLPFEISVQDKKDLLKIVNFVTIVASGMVIDKRRGLVEFVPSKTMPMRMAKQIIGLGEAFVLMNKLAVVDEEDLKQEKEIVIGENQGALTEKQINILYKIMFDSIPIKRRTALRELARYKQGVGTAGLATSIGYQTIVVNSWLAQLNALGICTREKRTGPKGDKWMLREEFRDIMVRFEKIQMVDASLDVDEVGEIDDSWTTVPQEERGDEMSSLDFEMPDVEMDISKW